MKLHELLAEAGFDDVVQLMEIESHHLEAVGETDLAHLVVVRLHVGVLGDDEIRHIHLVIPTDKIGTVVASLVDAAVPPKGAPASFVGGNDG